MPDEERPFTTFRFSVEINLPGESNFLCEASFSECAGLEMTMEPKTIREGGNNSQQIHFTGPVSYGQLTLKRGMTTSSFALWDWFSRSMQKGQNGLRANILVKMMSSDWERTQVSFDLKRCLPIKLSVPSLNAADGLVAIEEMQIAYEILDLKRPSE